MRAAQIRNWPATPLRCDRCVIIDRRSLDEAGRDMVPAGEFDGLVEPADRHPWQSTFEPGECRRVARQDIQTDTRHTLRIARKPSRPDRKHAVRSGEALDEVVKSGPDREGRALRRRHLPVHDDDCTRSKPSREIGGQHTRRTVTDYDGLVVANDVLQKVRGPGAPGRRLTVIGQYVRNLDATSRRPQAFSRWLQLDARTSGPATRMKCNDMAFQKNGRGRSVVARMECYALRIPLAGTDPGVALRSPVTRRQPGRCRPQRR